MADNKAKAVRSWLLGEIKRGTFGADRPLPGDLEVAARLDVSRGTVRAAFDDLRRQGLIERRRGAGTFLSKRGLRKSGVLGLLLPEIDACAFFRDVEDAFVKHCRRFGYEVEIRKIASRRRSDIALEMRRYARELAVRPVEGVVFRPLISEAYARINQEIVRIFERADTPVVLFDADVERRPRRSACDIVAVNNVDAGRRVAEHLIERGRRRIAFLMVDCVKGMNDNLNNRFFGVAGQSVLRGLRDGVRPVDVAPLDGAALRRLLRSRWRPDAFVCGNDEVAVDLLETLLRIGVRVPEDVAIVGFDDVDCARSSVPPLTTVRQPSRLIVQTLFKVLFFRIRNREAPPQEICLDAPVVCRRTT